MMPITKLKVVLWKFRNLYFLLFFIFCWDRYKLFTNIDQQLRQPQKHHHLFFYQSFLFDQRSTHNNTAGLDQIKLVVLLMAEREHIGAMMCVKEDWIGMKRMSTKREQMNSLGICALDLFIITCTIETVNSFINPRDSTYKIVMENGATHLEIKPMKPNNQPRELVLCISRVFAFERWQLFLTAIEAYRAFKVDLVVTHIQSALSSIFQLMRIYEREGILTIRPGIKLPHFNDMPWEPNAETEFNGQIMLAHECFYEFRESANFIALIDWDDLLVPSKMFSSLPSAFNSALNSHPNTAYFLVNKLESTFIEKRTNPKKFRLHELLSESIRTAPMYNDEKLVVVPRRLRGFWMHNSVYLEANTKPVQLLSNYSLLLHLANEERVERSEFRKNIMKRFDTETMEKHSIKAIRQMDKEKILAKLPKEQKYFGPIVDCHRLIFAYYKTMVLLSKPQCVSYSLCVLPKVEEQCTMVQSKWSSKLSTKRKMFIHLRTSSQFIESEHGCVSPEGI